MSKKEDFIEVKHNTIRLLRLIPNNKGTLVEKALPITAKNIEGLFDNLEAIIASVGEEDSVNLFYTVAQCTSEDKEKLGKYGEFTKRDYRVLVKQEVIPFDLDHVCLEQGDEYLTIFSKVTGIPLDHTIVVYTGNGIQILVRSAEAILSDNFFKTRRLGYKIICDKLQQAFEEENLAGEVDTSVFSEARLLRLPETYNAKPMADRWTYERAKAEGKRATLHPIYRKLGEKVLELQEDTTATKMIERDVAKKNSEIIYHSPDVATIKEECLFIKGCLEGTVDVHEPDCYAFLNITGFFQDDDKTSWEGLNKFSSPTIDVMDKEAKLIQAKGATTGPRTCRDIGSRQPDICNGCKHKGKITTPLAIQGPEYFIQLVKEMPSSPKEMQIVHALCMAFSINFDAETGMVKDSPDSMLVKDGQSSDVFSWVGSHWFPIFGEVENKIKQKISHLYKYAQTNGKIESTFELFKKYIPSVPDHINMYSPNPFCTNFSNCTVKSVAMPTGGFELISYPHRKYDYLTYALPLRYEECSHESNTRFNNFIASLFEHEHEGLAQEKIMALKQMFGAALMPMYPHLFCLKGVAGGGKSTVCKLLSYLLKKENLCAVEPKDFLGFDMESMAGKLVNMVTDLDTTTPIQDAVVKRIEDRTALRIKRKNRTDLYAPIPSLHVFGCNSLPRMQDGSSGAHERRWTIVEFNKSFTKDGQDYNRYFAEEVFSHDPQGIMNFAVNGLRVLMESKGKYKNPGKALLQEWQNDSDVTLQFLEAVKDKEVAGVYYSSEALVSMKELYQHFRDWCEMSGVLPKYICSYRTFTKRMNGKLETYRTSTERMYKGIGTITKIRQEF